MNEYKKEHLQSAEKLLLNQIERIADNPRGEPLTWGATPLVLSPDVISQQINVKKILAELFESSHVPSFVSDNLASYIEVLNTSRTLNREAHNTESFIYRKKTDLDGVPLEALEVFDRAINGFASPAELLLVSKLLGIPTIELASLTHPYGQRIEELKDMRPAINNAILLMGGKLSHARGSIFEVKGSDNPNRPDIMEGLHITRKTLFGSMPDGTNVIERSSFVLLVDQLPQETALIIRSIPYGPYWSEQILRLGKIYTFARLLLDGDKHDKAIPVSTTTVAINDALSKELLSDEAIRARQRRFQAAYASKI
jgi:hypothetical protein